MLKISVVLLLVVVACTTALSGEEILDVDNKEVKEIAVKAAYALNEKLPGPFHHTLVKITSALRNTPNIFQLILVMGETACKKQELTYEEAKQCDIQDAFSAYRKCKVNYFVRHSAYDFSCHAITGRDIC